MIEQAESLVYKWNGEIREALERELKKVKKSTTSNDIKLIILFIMILFNLLLLFFLLISLALMFRLLLFSFLDFW